MRTLAGAIAAVAMTVVLAVGFVAHRSPASGGGPPVRLHGDAVWAAGARPAPPMRLRDQHGRAVSLAELRGRVLLVTFMDSHCTTECPVEGHQLAVVQRTFPAAEPARDRGGEREPGRHAAKRSPLRPPAWLAWRVALAHGIIR